MFRKNPSKTDQIHTVLLSFVFFSKKFIAEHVTSKVKMFRFQSTMVKAVLKIALNLNVF